jgi:hypothetical protein
MTRSTRIKDCRLKGCVVGQKCKNNITGSIIRGHAAKIGQVSLVVKILF